MAKRFVTDTKLAEDPTQDNCSKGKSKGVLSGLDFLAFEGVVGLLLLCFLFGYGGHLLGIIVACGNGSQPSLALVSSWGWY